MPGKVIIIKGARTNNLKSIDLQIAKQKITAIVGVSGAGKTSLAFHTIYAEAYLRYLESISPYIRQFLDKIDKPPVDAIENLPPAIAFRHKKPVKSRRAIVATLADIFDYFRSIYTKMADLYCPNCEKLIKKYSLEDMIAFVYQQMSPGKITICFSYQGDYSFLLQRGYYFHWQDGKRKKINRHLNNKKISVEIDTVDITPANRSRIAESFERSIELTQRTVVVFFDRQDFHFPIKLYCPTCQISYDNPIESLFSFNTAAGACAACKGLGVEMPLTSSNLCPSCQGQRFNPWALSFRLQGKNIAELLNFTVAEAYHFFHLLLPVGENHPLFLEVIEEIQTRLKYLIDVGLSYIQLDRPAFTLSGGEFQRINLVNILCAPLSDSLLVIDQPTSDLHPYDYNKLIKYLQVLKKEGNTILMIEQNLDMVSWVDNVLELGPLAGIHGGEIMFSGNKDDFFNGNKTLSQKYFMNKIHLKKNCFLSEKWFVYENASGNNLKNFSFQIPSGALTVIAGVSGAGKTTLLVQDIFPFSRKISNLKDILLMTSNSMEKRKSSTVASFFDLNPYFFELFSGLKESRLLQLTSSHFSLHSTKGQCPQCHGRGQLDIEMQFLPTITTCCQACSGTGYNPDVLKVKYKNKRICDWWLLPIQEVKEILVSELKPYIAAIFERIILAGMGYIQLGLRLSTFSTGEWQRLKLIKFLNDEKRDSLFLVDEPCLGLHPYDVELVIKLIEKLLFKGNTVVVVDNNLNLIAKADYIIELGPEGGNKGGYLIFSGTLTEFIKSSQTRTSLYVRQYL